MEGERERGAVGTPWRPLARLFWLLVAAAFAGAVVEALFMLLTRGVWMSRSSLLYGQFSLVWGLGAALFTLALGPVARYGRLVTFLAGAVCGTFFELACSLVGERCFGVVFWDYSHLPLSIFGGRVNLAFSVFWGLAAVGWMFFLLPPLDRLLSRAPVKGRRLVTGLAAVLLILDVALSAAALWRLNARQTNVPAGNAVEAWLDETYPDEALFDRYQNMAHLSTYRRVGEEE